MSFVDERTTTGLLERSGELGALAVALAEVRASGRGRLVLVGGEAGVGKTALVRAFADEQVGGAAARFVWGACDALFTPRALGPLVDVAEEAGGELAAVIDRGAAPHEVTNALLRELGGHKPAVLVIEDAHWADDATLDVLRLLARRVESAPALVVVTYRNDELDLAHPLRIVVGELARTRGIERLEVPRLSPEAVARLAHEGGLDADELYRTTSGNPFFVAEVLAAGGAELPHTVRDAVLARAGRLSPEGRALLSAVAVVPGQVELWLLEALAPEHLDRLEEGLGTGILATTRDGVAFRHDVARMVLEKTIAPDRARALHRAAVAALAAPPAGAPDPARLAHHAEAAGDAAAVLRFAPEAAARAERVGAHREAAAQYARALRFADALPDSERVTLLEGRSREAFRADDCHEAIDALEGALDCHRALGDAVREGDSLRVLADVLLCPGDRYADAEQAGRDAVAVLERVGPSHELGMAYAQMASLCMNREDAAGTVEWCARATALAERLGDGDIRIHALNTLGTMELLAGKEDGRRKLERSLALAREGGPDESTARAYGHLAWAGLRERSFAVADAAIAAGLKDCAEPRFDLWRLFFLGFRARSELGQGRWSDAAATAALVIDDRRSSSIPRIQALTTLALVRARRGDPDVATPLAEAIERGGRSGELQRIEAVAAARAEVAWLAGDRDAVVDVTAPALAEARSVDAGWVVGELETWRRRAGAEHQPAGAAGPYALELAGRAVQAAGAWSELGCPYEAALALAHADDDVTAQRGLAALQEVGAQPAAAIVARRLRERGVRGLPRGPRAATRDNPAGLTARELEVLELVAEGMRNADIAQRLFLSEKTVAHHVSAILRKLDVRTRGEASAAARHFGDAAARS